MVIKMQRKAGKEDKKVIEKRCVADEMNEVLDNAKKEKQLMAQKCKRVTKEQMSNW